MWEQKLELIQPSIIHTFQFAENNVNSELFLIHTLQLNVYFNCGNIYFIFLTFLHCISKILSIHTLISNVNLK